MTNEIQKARSAIGGIITSLLLVKAPSDVSVFLDLAGDALHNALKVLTAAEQIIVDRRVANEREAARQTEAFQAKVTPSVIAALPLKAPVPAVLVGEGTPEEEAALEEGDIDAEPKPEFAGQLKGADAIHAYVFGGNSRFTLRHPSQERYTYRVKLAEASADGKYPAGVAGVGPYFVSVLTGADNENDFSFIGTARAVEAGFKIRYAHSPKSRLGQFAPSVGAWAWLLQSIVCGDDIALDQCEVWHDGTCGKCGRALTVPESVASGLGPICAGRS